MGGLLGGGRISALEGLNLTKGRGEVMALGKCEQREAWRPARLEMGGWGVGTAQTTVGMIK